MSAGDSRLTAGRAAQPFPRFLQLSQLRKLHACQQVAAVCYRIGSSSIEFLLVRTRGGRWTFPKGGVEPGLTHAQVAALEAFEEAGVHGRMEEASFARYIRYKSAGKRHSQARSAKDSAEGGIVVSAHLCEVLRLSPPQEPKRDPTWFSAEKAKRRLREDRRPDDGTELARVVDRAVARIQALYSEEARGQIISAPGSHPSHGRQKDALQKVHFEALGGVRAITQASSTSLVRYIRRHGGDVRHRAAIDLAVKAWLCKVQQIGPNRTGSTTPPNVHFIDNPGQAIIRRSATGQRSRRRGTYST